MTDITVTNPGKLIVFPSVQLFGQASTAATVSITDASVTDYDISNPGTNYSNPVLVIFGRPLLLMPSILRSIAAVLCIHVSWPERVDLQHHQEQKGKFRMEL